jgi:hypothetical protein
VDGDWRLVAVAIQQPPVPVLRTTEHAKYTECIVKRTAIENVKNADRRDLKRLARACMEGRTTWIRDVVSCLSHLLCP